MYPSVTRELEITAFVDALLPMGVGLDDEEEDEEIEEEEGRIAK